MIVLIGPGRNSRGGANRNLPFTESSEMLYATTKAILSGAIIAVASEVAKRNPVLGAVILSLPLVSVLAFVWLWRDTGDKEAIASFVPIYILVRAANATNVPGASGAAAKRSFLLVCTGSSHVAPNRGPLFLSRMALTEVRDCLLRRKAVEPHTFTSMPVACRGR